MRAILEDFDGNEFLPDFYTDRTRWSLAMQLSFLASRHEQLTTIRNQERGPVVADYTFGKDKLFARLLLQGRELTLYERIHRCLNSHVARPDLVVYLDANNKVLCERIQRRDRKYEKVTGAYLDELRDAYERHYIVELDVPIIRIDTTEFDIDSKDQVEAVFRQILS